MEPRTGVEGPQWGPRESLKLLNHDLRRVDGPEKVTGRARYTHDIRLPGMVYARLVLCPFPVAKVAVDASAAAKLPGVVAARGLRNEAFETRFLGQAIAVVAAETLDALEDGLRAMRVDCTPMPWAVDAEQALASNAPKVTKNGNVGKDSTVGDERKALEVFGTGDAKVEAEYLVPVQHHCSLETHGVVVDYRGGDEATVYCSTQGTFIVPEAAAGPLGLKQDKVTSVVEYMGGGFGSKFDFGIEGKTACELARELKRPVHLMLTREQEFLMAGNRSGTIVKVRAAAKKDGTLIAMLSDVHRMGGIGGGAFDRLPYIYRVQDKEDGTKEQEGGPKAKDGVRSAIRSLFTNTDSSRAMRAPGRPQTSFPMESVLDELAFQLELDPLAMRKQNLENPIWHRQLDRAAERIGWNEHPNKTAPQEKADADGTKTGIGFAICVWGGGGSKSCEVKVSIRSDGSIQAAVGTQDLGTGTRTYVAAITAEEFGLPLDAVTARIGNSSLGNANASGGSQTTASLAPAVKDAAYNAAQAFLKHLAGVAKRPVEELAFRGGSLVEAAGPKALMTWKEACATLGTAGLSADGEWRQSLADNGVHGAQAAKVKVDVATGRVQVVQMVGVQDCGLPLNRKAVESQLNGGMIQGLSFALHEERVIDPALGLMLNANFNDYKIAGCQEMPELVPLIDEDDIGRNPIGMAEPAIIPGHSAIANAIFNACGVRLRSLPFTADKVLDGLAALAAKGGAK